MEEEKKTVITTQEIEENMEEKETETMKEEGPNFAPLSAQDLAVGCLQKCFWYPGPRGDSSHSLSS